MKTFTKALFILGLFFSSFIIRAQNYETWYQAGPQFKVVSAKMTVESDSINTSDIDSEIGYQFGLFFRVNINKIYVQPELLYSTIKTQLVFQDFNGVPGFNPVAEFEFNTIELPIDIGYRAGNFRLNMGPSFSFLLSGQRSFLNEVEDITDEYNTTSMLWHFGFGADAKRLMFDIRYEFGLSKTGESLSNLIGTESIPKQRQWLFSVGFNLMNDY